MVSVCLMDGLSMFENGCFIFLSSFIFRTRFEPEPHSLGITVSLGAHIDGDVLKSQRSVFQRPTVSFREIQTWVMAGWLSNGGQQKLGIQTRPRRMEIWLINPSKWLLLVHKPFQFFLAYQLGPLGIIVAG